jgi:glycosyltransferase involved in cell wall biosynthesis
MRTERPDGGLLVNVVGRDHGGGLTTDMEILAGALRKAGCRVRFNGHVSRHKRGEVHRIVRGVGLRVRHGVGWIGADPIYDINLFLESIASRYLPHARLNCFLPNPEWFRESTRDYLHRIDCVLCKTRTAVDIFKPLASDVRYLGFTSADRLDGEHSQPDELLCLHGAGGSLSKGTSAVVEAWLRHPEWPHLIVIQHPFAYGGEPMERYPHAANIEYVFDRLDDATWRRYQNECAVHVCPSEAEGFGHVLVEAMSCGAVLVTTDGPPMNELVTIDRGLLVRPARAEPMRLGTAYYVDIEDLERQVDRVVRMTREQRRLLGNNARRWYETQSAAFAQRLEQFIDEHRPAQPARG